MKTINKDKLIIMKFFAIILFFSCPAFSLDVTGEGKVVLFSNEILELEKNKGPNIEQIKNIYTRGRDWAFQRHIYCPPNPGDNKKLNKIIGYWVKGYVAGIKNGGISDMPSKYIDYFVYDKENILENDIK